MDQGGSGPDAAPRLVLPRWLATSHRELVQNFWQTASGVSANDMTSYASSMTASGLPDAQWERQCPLLSPQKPRTGRPAKDHRTDLAGIL